MTRVRPAEQAAQRCACRWIPKMDSLGTEAASIQACAYVRCHRPESTVASGWSVAAPTTRPTIRALLRSRRRRRQRDIASATRGGPRPVPEPPVPWAHDQGPMAIHRRGSHPVVRPAGPSPGGPAVQRDLASHPAFGPRKAAGTPAWHRRRPGFRSPHRSPGRFSDSRDLAAFPPSEFGPAPASRPASPIVQPASPIGTMVRLCTLA